MLVKTLLPEFHEVVSAKMQLKRYEVASLKEAIKLIREDLGSEAVVISTRDIGTGARKKLEVIAARDLDLTNRGDVLQSPAPSKDGTDLKLPAVARGEEKIGRELARLGKQLNRIEKKLTGQGYFYTTCGKQGDTCDAITRNTSGLPLQWGAEISCDLWRWGVSQANAARLCEACLTIQREEIVTGPEGEPSALEKAIERTIAGFTGKQLSKRIQLFAGPTGAGKTTTIAKLAADYLLRQKRKVGLVTADTFRVAALEQIRTYAKIMGVPLEIAGGREDFSTALGRLADRDVIFVDTPGRGGSDEGHIRYLREIIAADDQVELNLVLSLTSNNEYLLDTVASYDIIPYGNIILTKADECSTFGFLYDFLHGAGKNVSHLTIGQNVPRDIVVSTASRLTKLIVEAKLH